MSLMPIPSSALTIPVQAFQDQLHIHQSQVLYLLDTPLNKDGKRLFDLKWHRKARKSTLLINILIRECYRHPNSIYSYVGPTYKQSRSIIWDDPNMLDKYLPPQGMAGVEWTKNEQKLHITFKHKSRGGKTILRILGADNIDSLRGPDNMGVGFDEWQLINPQAWTAIFFPMINLFPDRWAIFLWTAFGRNHAQELREVRQKDKRWVVLTLPAYDTSFGKASGLLTQAQLETARLEMPESLYKQEYGCEDIAEEEMCLINSAMIAGLREIDWERLKFLHKGVKRIVSIDTAFGGDVCSIRGMENGKSIEVDHSHPSKTEEIVIKAKKMCYEMNTKNVISDCIGWGKGVTDALALDVAGYNVQAFNSANSSSDEMSIYANRRAEAYGYAANQIRQQKVPPIEEAELIRQLPKASRFKASTSGKIQVVSKSEIRKDLGCSPDDADSYVMGLWGLQFVENEEVINRGNSHRGVIILPPFIRLGIA